MEAPGHAGVEFPFIVVGAVEVPFEFEPQAAVVAEFGRNAGADVVPRIVMGLIEAQAFQAVHRGQVEGAVPGKFMEDVGLEVPSLVGVDVTAEAESQAADEAVDAVEVLMNTVAGPEVGPVDVSILKLALGLDVPRIAQFFLAAPFDAGLLVPGPEGALRGFAVEKSRRPFAVNLSNAADDVEIMALLTEPGLIEAARVALVLALPFGKGGLAAKVAEGKTLTKGTSILSLIYAVEAQFKAVAVTIIAVTAEVAIGQTGPHARIFPISITSFAESFIEGIHIRRQVEEGSILYVGGRNDVAFDPIDSREVPVRRIIRCFVGEADNGLIKMTFMGDAPLNGTGEDGVAVIQRRYIQTIINPHLIEVHGRRISNDILRSPWHCRSRLHNRCWP